VHLRPQQHATIPNLSTCSTCSSLDLCTCSSCSRLDRRMVGGKSAAACPSVYGGKSAARNTGRRRRLSWEKK